MRYLCQNRAIWDNKWFKNLIVPFIIGILLIILENGLTQKNEPPELDSYLITDDEIKIIYNLKPRNLSETIQEIREKNSLRELINLESGRRILNTPKDTFFYVFGKDFNLFLKKDEDYKEKFISKAKVEFENNPEFAYFEIHYLSNNKIYLLGFLSEDVAASLSKIPRREGFEFSIYPTLWKNSINSLVIMPMNSVDFIERRHFKDFEGNVMSVLDITLK